MKHDSASNPLTERYASQDMSYLFSPNFKFRTWRRLWVALAEAEQELGLPITDGQLAELRQYADQINYEDAELMLFGVGMLVVLIAFPGGLAGVPDALARRFASRWRP